MAPSIPSVLAQTSLPVSSPPSLPVSPTPNPASVNPSWPKKLDFTAEQLERLYWNKSSWSNREKAVNAPDQPKGKRGKGRAAEGINVNMLYVVDEQGNPVDGHRAADIRRIARSIWTHLLSRSLAPERWSSASMRATDLYQNEMQTRCEELRLCEGAWKAHQIAFDFYWSWRAGKEKQGAFNVKCKDEDESGDLQDEKENQDITLPKKRPGPAISSPTKHRRSSSDTSIAPPGNGNQGAEPPTPSVQVRSCHHLRR